MKYPDQDQKLEQFQAALEAFIERIKEDRWVLAVVLVGSINEETIWKKDGIWLWLVEADGVSRRRKSDGEEHRIWRTMVERDINLWAELIPRTRFKKMVEGASRTTFSYNFFARRQLVYSADESITNWFEEANDLAVRDQKNELLMTTCWVMYGVRHVHRLLDIKKDLNRAWQAMLDTAHSLAAAHVVEAGEICETHTMHRAMELNPALFETTYTNLLAAGGDESAILTAVKQCEAWIEEKGFEFLTPVTKYLKKQRRSVSLSELSDQFASSQLYPWHLESACELLVEAGRLEKLASEMLLTKKSRHHVEEPAYLLQ